MFKLIKEIKSKEGVLHFKRWSIFSSKKFSIYIHGIYKPDEDEHLHNHPWNISTIILWGSYLEELDIDDQINHWHESKSKKTLSEYLGMSEVEYKDFVLNHKNKIVKRHWLHFGYRPRKHFHKIKELLSKKVYSLAIVWGERSEWGYNVKGKEINHEEYRKLKHKNKQK